MSHDTLYILAAPGQFPQLAAGNHFPAWLAYRVSPDFRLLRTEGPSGFRGGVMVISGCAEAPHGDPGHFCRTLLAECARHGFQGVLLDFDSSSPGCELLGRTLARVLPGRGITLFLPECLGHCAQNCRVLIPSALSGGSLEGRLKGAVENYGADRVVLSTERISEDFTLPAPTGCGRPLSSEELERLKTDLRPRLHFSAPLCTWYFTYRRNASFHLVLCDDERSLREKLTCARRCGVHRFLLPWRDISSSPGDFLP